jgi:hypothetical protein
MTRRLRHTLAIFALAAALLSTGAVAGPADTTDTAASVDADAVEKATLMRMLNAPSVATQERAVRLIGTYAHTGRYDADFFRLFVTPLHGLVAEGRSEAVRIMALSALSSIGTDRAMQGLRTRVDALTSDRVRRMTRYALAAYDVDRRVAAKRAGQQR